MTEYRVENDPAPEELVEAMTGMKIYTASRTAHAWMWLEARNRGVNVIASWIDEAGEGETDDWSDLWVKCISEASSADRLVAYHEDGDEWKGVFVEIGAALVAGVPVTVVGDPPGSWLHHPLVSRSSTIEEALELPNPLPLATDVNLGDVETVIAWCEKNGVSYVDLDGKVVNPQKDDTSHEG